MPPANKNGDARAHPMNESNCPSLGRQETSMKLTRLAFGLAVLLAASCDVPQDEAASGDDPTGQDGTVEADESAITNGGVITNANAEYSGAVKLEVFSQTKGQW